MVQQGNCCCFLNAFSNGVLSVEGQNFSISSVDFDASSFPPSILPSTPTFFIHAPNLVTDHFNFVLIVPPDMGELLEGIVDEAIYK
ncbi:hypothetical protein L596_014729 [Steinernema carpocapsae]|uniref:Uncharacterized protein n=1 Tax=Steinernema carpocapsae TaxID=34508 RepID=A0A4U5NCR3_STECR|nr:hypothetical protein L596_014729 [Steinernema carpocapsae]